MNRNPYIPAFLYETIVGRAFLIIVNTLLLPLILLWTALGDDDWLRYYPAKAWAFIKTGDL